MPRRQRRRPHPRPNAGARSAVRAPAPTCARMMRSMLALQPNLVLTTAAGESVRRPPTATFSTRSPSTCGAAEGEGRAGWWEEQGEALAGASSTRSTRSRGGRSGAQRAQREPPLYLLHVVGQRLELGGRRLERLLVLLCRQHREGKGIGIWRACLPGGRVQTGHAQLSEGLSESCDAS